MTVKGENLRRGLQIKKGGSFQRKLNYKNEIIRTVWDRYKNKLSV